MLTTLCSSLYPRQISVVHETRLYASWNDSPGARVDSMRRNDGIAAAKAELNALHKQLAEEGFNQVHSMHTQAEIGGY